MRSISFRSDQHAFAKAFVDSGRFPYASAVVHQGLDLLKQQDADAQADRVALQALLLERANAPFLSTDQLRAKLATRSQHQGSSQFWWTSAGGQPPRSDTHRGESHDELLPGLRHFTFGRAVYWFRIRSEQREIQVRAMFFGGQDHHRHMLARLSQ